MLKKFFAVMILAAAMVFVGSQNNFAEAREVYVGNYSDGTAVYLLTETVSMGRPFGDGSPQFTCRVRAGRDYLNYRFFGTGYNAYQKAA